MYYVVSFHMCFGRASTSLEDVAFLLHEAVLCNVARIRLRLAWLLTLVFSPCGSSQPCGYELFPVPALCI